MAVVIAPFGHQDVVVNSPFSIDVPVSGNPRDVLVVSRLNGFSYHWTGTQIELRGTPNVYMERVPLVISADTASYTGTFSVIPVRPVIGPLTPVSVQRGVDVTIPVPITGHVSKLVISGPLLGLKCRKTEGGGELYGIINASADFTKRILDFRVTAFNREVSSTATLTIEIQ